ncbi:thioesterase family protein [Sphingomonas sp. MMS24-JH45]
MPRPEPRRLLLDTYPRREVIRTRFQDLDLMGHLNNVAFAALFEDARVRFNGLLGRMNCGDGFRAVVANTITYLAEERTGPMWRSARGSGASATATNYGA